MNLLFLNYDTFTSNSLNHIGAFANRLVEKGHACVVAVPDRPETIEVLPSPLFRPATFAKLASNEPVFPDRQGADIVHVWTPRENVRAAALNYLRQNSKATLFIHLEDNEEVLIASFARTPIAELRKRSDSELASLLPPQLSHPTRFPLFLQLAHGITYITDRLREFCPPTTPVLRLLPGIDPALYRPQPADAGFRAELGLAQDEKVIVYTGSTTFANLADVRSLILAVRAINQRGVRCRLIRTGINPPEYDRELVALGEGFVLNLGFIDKRRLSPLLALADVLVQPGAPDAFNDYRLPSKIPEFMCAGRPVVIPRANLGREMEHGKHALLLEQGTPEEIANRCLEVLRSPDLAAKLADGAVAFAKQHFDLEANTVGLLRFYEEIRPTARPIFPSADLSPDEDVLVACSLDPMLGARVRARAETQSALTKKLAALEERLAELERRLTQFHGERAHAELLERQLGFAVEAQARANREADEARSRIQQLTTELGRRDDKIRRMTQSGSWQFTAPFRSARRLLFDPWRKPVAMSQASVETFTTPAPGFSTHFDEPRDWACVPANATLRGWIIPPAGRTIIALRARLADAEYSLAYGLPRHDVLATHGERADGTRCGFHGTAVFVAGAAGQLTIEALTDDGTWHCVAKQSMTVGEWVRGDRNQAYTAWLKQYAATVQLRTIQLKTALIDLSPERQPLVSVLMPTYNTPDAWLARAIESVRSQTYSHWELCIADDSSSRPGVSRMLQAFAERDPRIKFVVRPQNGHICAASNTALELATGDWIALLDHDDELAPHALASLVHTITTRPEARFIYSDEDKVAEDGRRFDPNFKPDWNPDLLRGQNYCCHLSAFRTDLVRELGGFRTGTEGSQDWDLALRVTERLQPGEIVHIPEVLYHWRAIKGSTALALGEKSYAQKAARRVLQDHLTRTAVTADLMPVEGGHWRIRHRLPAQPPLVSLIIPTHNGEKLVRQCIESLRTKTSYPRCEIILVNNRSNHQPSLGYFKQLALEGVRVLDYDAPFNFSAINNFAVRHAQGTVLGFLNNDLEAVHDDWLDEMVTQALRPEIGAVGALLHYPDGGIQHAGIVLGIAGPMRIGGVAGHAFKCFPRGSDGYFNRLRLVQNYSAVTAACLVIRREIFEQVGGFNEDDLPVAFNDVDFCLRVRAAGYRNLWTPFAELYHHESASRGAEDTPEKQARFKREIDYMRQKWAPLLDRDPCYNPNLTLLHEDFSLAWPPRSISTSGSRE